MFCHQGVLTEAQMERLRQWTFVDGHTTVRERARRSDSRKATRRTYRMRRAKQPAAAPQEECATGRPPREQPHTVPAHGTGLEQAADGQAQSQLPSRHVSGSAALAENADLYSEAALATPDEEGWRSSALQDHPAGPSSLAADLQIHAHAAAPYRERSLPASVVALMEDVDRDPAFAVRTPANPHPAATALRQPSMEERMGNPGSRSPQNQVLRRGTAGKRKRQAAQIATRSLRCRRTVELSSGKDCLCSESQEQSVPQATGSADDSKPAAGGAQHDHESAGLLEREAADCNVAALIPESTALQRLASIALEL